MADGIYLSGSAMVARQVQQGAVVDNLANVSTPGYKATHVFSRVLDNVEASVDALRNVEKSQQTWIDFSQGDLQKTDRALDFALKGDGFFVVQTPEGPRYTRNGSFSVDPKGTLVTSDGHPVLGNGGPLRIHGNEIVANARGELFVDGKNVGQLQLRSFEDTRQLVRAGSGLFEATDENALTTVAKGELCQGCLEGSNVKTADQMLQMMSIMKNYEAAQRIAKLQSQTLGRTVNELVR